MKYKLLLIGALMVLPFSSFAGLMQNKLYKTGEPVAEKPMQLHDFVELTTARKVSSEEFTDLQGNTKSLAQHKGKVILLNIWATWCEPCVREMPPLLKLKDELKDSLDVVLLSIDEDTSLIAPFLAEHKFDVQTWIDKEGAIGRIVPTNIVPATFMFDTEGNLVGFIRGYVDWDNEEVHDFLRRFATKYQNINK